MQKQHDKNRKSSDIPIVNLTVKYNSNGTGFADAYRILARKVIERRSSHCGQQSISG